MSRTQEKLKGYRQTLNEHANYLTDLKNQMQEERRWRKAIQKRDRWIGGILGLCFFLIGATLDMIAERTLLITYSVGFGGFQILLVVIGLCFWMFALLNTRR